LNQQINNWMQYTSIYMMILKQNNINNDNSHVSVHLAVLCSTRQNNSFHLSTQNNVSQFILLKKKLQKVIEITVEIYYNFVLSRKSPPHNMACYICKPTKLAQHKSWCYTMHYNQQQHVSMRCQPWHYSVHITDYFLSILEC